MLRQSVFYTDRHESDTATATRPDPERHREIERRRIHSTSISSILMSGRLSRGARRVQSPVREKVRLWSLI